MLLRQIFLLNLFYLTHSTILLQDFNEILLPPSTTLDFIYLDYFEGVQLKYTVENANLSSTRSLEPEIKKTYKKYPTTWPQSSVFREMVTLFDYSHTYTYYFSSGLIGCLKSNTNIESIDQLWITQVDSSKANFTISALSLISYKKTSLAYTDTKTNPLSKISNPKILDSVIFSEPNQESFNKSSYLNPNIKSSLNQYILLVVGQDYSQDPDSPKNIFYTANLNNTTANPSFVSISLPLLENITQLSVSNYFSTNILSFGGCDGDKAYDFIYKFTVGQNPVLIQKIFENTCLKPLTNYSSFPLENVVLKMQNSSYQLIVLDRAYGLESYIMEDGVFKVGFDIDMSLYGDLLGFKEYLDPANMYNQAFVKTIHGVFVIQTSDMSEINHIVNIDSKGNENFIKGVYFYNDFVYLIFIEEESKVSIGIVNTEYPRSIIDYAVFNSSNVNKDGQWVFLPGSTSIMHIRIDKEVINTFICNPVVPKLTVKSKEMDSVYLIEAVDIYSDVKNSILRIILTTPDMYKIILTDNGSYYTTPPTIVNNFLISDGNIEIPAYMFSGWNLTCGLESFENYDYITVVDNTPVKVEYYKNLSYSDSDEVFYVDNYIVIAEKEKFLLVDFEDDTVLEYGVPNVAGIGSIVSESIQAFYVISNANNECTCFLISNFTITPIETYLKDCQFIQVSEDYLVISSYEKITIYSLDSQTSLKHLLTLSIESILLAKIEHLSMSILTDLNTLLYIGTQKSIHIINLNSLNIDDHRFYFISTSDKINYNTFISGHQTLTIASNEKIIVYDNYISNTILTLDINAKKLFQLGNYVLASNDTSVFLLDTKVAYMRNSVIFANETNRNVLGMMLGKSGYGYIAMTKDQKVDIYKVRCLMRNASCENNVMVKVDVDTSKYTENSAFNLNLNITCWNEISSKSTVIAVLLITYGMTISENQFMSDLKIEYGVCQSYFISEFFNGYDLQAEMLLNNKSVTYNEYLPAYISPSLQNSRKYVINDTMIDHDVITYLNYTCILTASNNILIVNIVTGNVDGNFSIIPKINVDLICMNIKYASTDESYTLLVVGCNYLTSSKQKNLKYSSGSVLISLIINLETKNLLSTIETEIDVVPIFTRIVRGTINTFIYLIIDGLTDDNYNNNHVWIYKGNWNSFDVNIIFEQAVNYYTLNIDKFCAITLDGTYDYNHTLNLYVVDYWYGVRALISYNGGVMKITDGQYLDDIVSSIGLCGKILFLGFDDTSVMMFKLIQGYMEYYMTYFPYSNSSANYTAIRGFISCNNYYTPNYITLPMKSDSMVVVRVISTFSNYASSVVRDIKVTSNFQAITDFSKVVFLNSTSFFTLDTQLNYLKIFSLQAFSIVFPALSIAQYKKMKEKWDGNKFEMVLHIYNGRSSVRTTPISLEIINDDDSDESEYPSSVPWWQIFIIVIGVVFVLIITVVTVYKIAVKNRMRKRQSTLRVMALNLN